MFSYILLVSAAVSLVSSAAIVPVPVASNSTGQCEHGGKFYPVGSFQPTPCEPCQCTPSGQAFCAIVDCFFNQCVDAVHDPKHCCPQCPNGANCQAPDGTIIKDGESYRPDADTVCSCPSGFGGFGGFGGRAAVCAMKAHNMIVDHPQQA